MESRITELEVKLAFQEDLLETLNLTVAKQQRQIELLQEQMQALYQQLPAATGAGADGGPVQEIPPHY
ncbi:SlyX family protein [Cupriavidus gilardii]|uniref:SlyX family protein n=1 Tax=Cupriavidus gilardii TaxID=82541 RepID=UPI001EE54E21|nr:SlyX family protein [Cupriavidus gilardii]MCG5262023.1 SlyX family protein [Cupriavidus gilardii]MDF9430634.1 SlyX family protein [Cupriavidus gilardii]